MMTSVSLMVAPSYSGAAAPDNPKSKASAVAPSRRPSSARASPNGSNASIQTLASFSRRPTSASPPNASG